MKKYIVLSVNDNQDYQYFTPLVVWAWRHFGWEVILFYTVETGRPSNELEKLVFDQYGKVGSQIHFINPKEFEDYRSDTITQISRLYAAAVNKDTCYMMTGDIDMLPLSDYWKPDPYETTVYGHDLTGFGHYPICYIGMLDSRWASVMHIEHAADYNRLIKQDLDTLPQAKDPDFYKYWFSDQDLITQRLNEYGKEKITFVNRGQGTHGFARGRVDRGSGGWVLNQPELIDAHLEQQTHHSRDKIERLYALLAHVWPGEDFTWFREYTNEFRKLTEHTG